MKGMTVIVKTVASWVKVLIFLFGIYIILFGHLTPGGGFAGGVILASSYVLLMLAFGRERAEENLSLPWASKLDCVGALLFAAIALCGLLYGGASFFYNFIHQKWFAGKVSALELVSAGTIPLSNLAIGLKVGTSLFLVVLTLSIFRLETSVSSDQKAIGRP
jgi:multisubunit Na+/H+ antiporter MnhB subunit